MSFARSIEVVHKDLPNFKRLADQMGTQDWHDFNVALEALIPLLEGWHSEGRKRLPSISEIAKTIDFGADKFTRVFNVLIYLAGHGVQMLNMAFEYQDNDQSFPVSGVDAMEVMKGGEFLHPTSGEPVESPGTKIHMTFEFREDVLKK